MKKSILLICTLLISLSVWCQNQEIEISGTISDGLQSLSGVNIQIDNSTRGTKTDTDGKYAIRATEGDILVFTHVGYEPLEIITEDMDRVLNLIMVPTVELLENVTVTKRIRKTQEKLFLEYNTNPNLIKTQFGILDKEVSGTSMYILDENQINPVAINILAVLNGKFPGVKISQEGDPYSTVPPTDPAGVIYIRGGGSRNYPTPAIYEVDGFVYLDPPLFLDVQNIKRIALLPSFASAAKYGNIGAGGIFIINTKSGNFSPKEGNSSTVNTALVQNNNFQNDALDYSEMSQDVPSYLLKLQASTNLEEAKRIYKEQENMHGTFPYFVLDAYQYFFDNEEKPKFADTVIKSKADLFENDPIALKSLAYVYQVQNRLKKANGIFKDLFILRPNYSQSYIDLANSYGEISQYKKATGIYARYQYLLKEGFMRQEKEFDAIMNREYKNLLKHHGKDLVNKRTQKKISSRTEYYNTRLVFEWNDSEAEFELQFVNPDGKYFNIEHSRFTDAERIKSQKLAGYAIEEFLIDNSMLGQWQVNVRYLGNKSLTTTFLKATIYKNYGSLVQQKETKLFKLRTKNINQKLFTVSNSASVLSN